jgi:hypothetical protein
MFRRLATALVVRRLARDLTDIAQALRQQNVLLARLADRLAPVDPPTERVEVREGTGVSHLDANEAYLAQRYIERTRADTGHTPDDDEVLIYLADEKTVDLHQRLAAREADLERLRAAREW